MSKAWYDKTKPKDAEQGCCGPTMGPIGCVDGTCAAYRVGTVKMYDDPQCTQRLEPLADAGAPDD